MTTSLAFKDQALEKGFQERVCQSQRPFSNFYHGLSVVISACAFVVLLLEWNANQLVSKLVIQATLLLLNGLALKLINTQPTIFQSISQPWHFLHRIIVCIRCTDIRSVWYTFPGHGVFLTPAISPHWFFSAMVVPVTLHCFGLPLPAGLAATSAAAMLAVIWSSNVGFCEQMAPLHMWSMFGASGLIERHVANGAKGFGLAYDPAKHENLAVMCQAKLGMMQGLTIVCALLGGLFLEMYRRRVFLLGSKHSVRGASCWPFGSLKLLSGIILDVSIIVVGFACMAQLYLWHLASKVEA